MIYLEKTASAQTVSIPRNDNGGTPSVNPRSYQEGYNAGFEAGEDVGYGDGVAYQKSLLSSTAITENGEYQSENGFSAVSVNVPQTGSSLPLTAITITANTAITETEKAYTGITVNVDTASTYNSGYTDGYTSGETDGYNTGYVSGETVGENNIISTFSAMTATTNGNYGSSAHPLSAITVDVPQTGQSVTLEEMDVTISADTTVVNPSQGYDGLSKVNIDATDYGNSKYNSGYTSGYTSGNTDGYDSGYTSGYSSGYTSGYSSGYSSGYTSGETDGYNSGYTSGHTDGVDEEKAKMSAVTFTANTAVTLSDGGYSAVTVNVPQTGTSLNVETNKPFTATSNGNYTITPSSYGVVSVYGGTHSFFIKTKGYTDNTYIGHIENWNNTERIDISWNASNNSLTADTTNWDITDINDIDIDVDSHGNDVLEIDFDDYGGIWFGDGDTGTTYDAMSAVSLTVNVPQTGSSLPLSSITITGNTAITVNDKAYTGITVNVPQSGETEPIISVTGSTWFVLDHIFQYGEKINIKHATFDYRAANIGRHQQLISGGYDEYLRIGGKGNVLYATYGNTNSAQTNYILVGDEIYLTPTEFVIDGVKYADVSSSTHTWNTNMVLFANTSAGSDSVRSQTASVGEITITDSANTITAHYVPMLDENDVPCFYNTVSDNYIYAESGTPIYSVVSTLTIDDLAIKRYKYINPHISVNPKGFSFYDAAGLYGDLSFGNSVTSIGSFAFRNCVNLNGSLTIPNSVTGIGEYAFAAAFSGTLTIPDSITEIKHGTFIGCNFTTVIIPSSVTDIKSAAFYWNHETDIYCYATTPPLIGDSIVGSSSSGRIHYPAGSDYTLWTQSSQFANWTFIDDL